MILRSMIYYSSAILSDEFSPNTASQYLANMVNLESEAVWSFTLGIKAALFSLYDMVLISDW